MNKYIDLPCDCRCSILHIEKDEDDGMLSLTIYEHMFGSKQQTIFRLIKERIKKAWKMLNGKDYYLYDLIINPKDSKEVLDRLINSLIELRGE